MKYEQTIGGKVWKLKGNIMRSRFQEKAKELVDVDAPNLWDAINNDYLI